VYRTPEGDVCGFLDIEDWKSVLRIDAEVVHLRERLRSEGERAELLSVQISEMKKQIVVHLDSQAVLIRRNDDLTKRLIDLDLKYQKEAARSPVGSVLPWAIAGASVSVLAGVLLATALR